MLQIIFGAAGCGKTCYARELAGRLAKEGKRTALIVPEQHSFETERAMLKLLGAQLAHSVEIFSFTRLAERVARDLGECAGKRLDNAGRAVVMSIALSELRGETEYYRGKRQSSDFISHLTDAVKEFKICSVTPEMLESACVKTDGTLSRKLHELSLIYRAYDAVAAQTALDPLDDLDRLRRHLNEHSFFSGCTVIIDSFRGFTGQELAIISQIMRQCEDCVITLCAEEPSGGGYGLFAPVQKTCRVIESEAKRCGVGVRPHIMLPERRRFNSPALAAVERGVFRFGAESEPYEAETADVAVYAADNKYDEAEYCARECRRLMREEGYRCRDIAVIARSEDAYADVIADAMELQKIPCFMDRRTPASGSALMQFVLAALETARGGWRLETLLRILKTGLVDGVTALDTAEIENYCLIWSVKGGDWRAPFTMNPDGMGCSELDERRSAALARINVTRQKLADAVSELLRGLKDATGTEAARTLFAFIESCGVPDALGKLCSNLDKPAAQEQAGLWGMLMSLLDQLADILGDRRISRDELYSLVSMMIDLADVGHIPQGLDEVVFGGADRIRLSAPRAVFVVGAADGVFPAAPKSTGVFTDDERRRLLELSVPVSEPLEEQLLEERLLAYSALSCACDRLYVTYPTGSLNPADKTGSFALPELVAEVLRCVPNAARVSPARELCSMIESEDAAFELAARHYSDASVQSATLLSCLSGRSCADRLGSVSQSANQQPLSLSGNIFGQSMHVSVSKIETYHRCKFEYFCKYILKASTRRKVELNSLEYGTAVHFVLEHILSERDTEEFISLALGDGLTEEIKRLLTEFLEREMGGCDTKSNRFLFECERLADSLAAIITNIAEELSCSCFKPTAFELSVGDDGDIKPETIILADSTRVTVDGKIDRVDTFTRDGVTYLRVIDYKTGKKSFRLSDIISGLNIQMLLYLHQLCGQDCKPAGVMYCPAGAASVSLPRNAGEQDAGAQRRKAYRRDGLLIDDTEEYDILDAMEKDIGGKYIPVKALSAGKKDSVRQLSKDSMQNVISQESFGIIGRYIKNVIAGMCQGLRAGDISPNPIMSGGHRECDMCDYFPICRYEGEPKFITGMSNLDAMAYIAGEDSQKEEQNA